MNAEGAHIKNENQPIFENITIDSAYIEDQGDIFHCGKCKLNFHSFFEFIAHKKEHAPRLSEHPSLETIVNDEDVNMVAFDNQPSQIWVWNPGDQVAENEIVVTSPLPQCDNVETMTSNIIDYETAVNYSTVQNPQDACDVTEIEINNTADIEMEPKIEMNLLTCSVCQKQFQNQFRFFQHLRSHSGERPYQCVICARTFMQKSTAKKHVLSHRVWPDGLSKTLPDRAIGRNVGFKCPYCEQISSSYSNLKLHLKEHGHQKAYKCIQEKCTAMYVELDSLISHIKVEHKVVEFQCHICSLKLNSLEEMSIHQKTHSATKTPNRTPKKYSCIYCSSIFKKQDHLAHHMTTANHSNRCTHCDKIFVSERALRRHITLHDEIKAFKCDICNASFRKKQYLIAHLSTHMKEKSFVCSVCSVKFSRKDMLMRHVKIHQPNKRKHCPFREPLGCTMEFTRTDKLNLHIKSHVKKMENKKKSVVNNSKSSKRVAEQSSTMEIIIVPLSSTNESLGESETASMNL